MTHNPEPIRGRGSADNPASRFATLSYVRDDASAGPEDPAPTTQFLKDTSRSIIAHNDSPDVGFDTSINPYRGCEHGCSYCLSGDTPILMADGTTKRLDTVGVGDAIYGTVKRGHYRYYVHTHVLAHWRVFKPAYRISLEDGTCLNAGGDHRFLTERGWKFVTGSAAGREQRPHLTTNNTLMGTGAFASPPAESQEYKRGYLCGLIRGDGHLACYAYERQGRAHGNQYQFRLALKDQEALERASNYLLDFGIVTYRFLFQEATAARSSLYGIRTHAREQVHNVEDIIAWPPSPAEDWSKGFLAGLFDAEGSYSQGVWRLSNTNALIIEHTTRCLKSLGFSFVIEGRDRSQGRPMQVVRLCGGLQEHLRFFHTVDTAIRRKRDIGGHALKTRAKLRVVAVEALYVSRPLFDITTGTGDFIANGVVSHNCYARPTHEYLGFSAGLDFETKILVKEDAPALLRRELSSPRWTPRVVAMSGVTDPYQPIERHLRLTRGCLEVLAEFRNPVAIITKNFLVTRDLDVLGELARYQAVAVFLSVTTLHSEVSRTLEPRASQPKRRLAAMAALAQAGVPVGVMVAPVIPGLTDHELPAIIAAAAKAGAQYAGYGLVRLPHGVGQLFEQWLSQHAPTKQAKILKRIQAIHGGDVHDSRFGVRMRGEGIFAEQTRALYALACRKAGLTGKSPTLSTAAFRRPAGAQLSLFES
jgi:DNA repair photolyase